MSFFFFLQKCLGFLKLNFLSLDFVKGLVHNNLSAILEKWKKAVDKVRTLGALMTFLSKSFDCLNHELRIGKRNVYGFALPALNLFPV